MDFAYRFRLTPTPDQEKRLAWTLDTCRQVRNHFLHRMNRVENPTYTPEQNRLPNLKKWWTDLQEINAKVLQMVVRRLYTDRSNLKKKKEKGHKVGKLKWKGKGYYHSFEYNQSGFELKETSGQDVLYLNKIGDVPIVAHRDLPADAIPSRASLSSANRRAAGTRRSNSKSPTTRPRTPTNSPTWWVST